MWIVALHSWKERVIRETPRNVLTQRHRQNTGMKCVGEIIRRRNIISIFIIIIIGKHQQDTIFAKRKHDKYIRVSCSLGLATRDTIIKSKSKLTPDSDRKVSTKLSSLFSSQQPINPKRPFHLPHTKSPISDAQCCQSI